MILFKSSCLRAAIHLGIAIGWVFVSQMIATSCQAGFSYSLGFGQTTYVASGGEEVSLDFYIRERVTAGSVPRLSIGNNDGLYSIGATITYTADFGSPATIPNLTDVAFTPGFDGFEVVLSPLDNRLEITSFLSPAALPYMETLPDPSDSNLYSILIGTVKFRLANTPGNTTTVTIDKRELLGIGAVDNNLAIESAPGFLELVNIDDTIQGGSAVIRHLNVVPEPGSLWLLMSAAALGWGQRCWNRGRLMLGQVD